MYCQFTLHPRQVCSRRKRERVWIRLCEKSGESLTIIAEIGGECKFSKSFQRSAISV